MNCRGYILQWLDTTALPVSTSLLVESISGAFGGASAVRGTIDRMVENGDVERVRRNHSTCIRRLPASDGE